ncbi:hypothetical protein [Clostridium ljungdahlii]|uniref:DUF115 domain-containing protein n=1 Tax=Clostridium ljungdahlii TaxID=1538 RepID=A0A170NBC3_9CLOT|nr:hypothetical protein [Clostridium ljungdahlii]OAA83179.1 hypothetical protein WY13_03507 [Clostridium ljungdahlii]
MDLELKDFFHYGKKEEENLKKNIKLLEKYQNIKIKNIDLNLLTHKVKKISENFVTPFVYKEDIWKPLTKEDGSDINEFVNEINLEYVDDVIIVFGFGIGYHIGELQKKYPNNRILVLECDFEIIKIAAIYGNLENVICSDKISIGLFKDSEELSKILKYYFGDQNRVSFIADSFANYDQIYDKEFQDLVILIDELKSDIEKNREKRIKLSEDILNSNSTINIITEAINNANSSNELDVNFNIKSLLQEVNHKSGIVKEGIKCLSKLYDFSIGIKNINVEKSIKRFNEIESEIQLSPMLLMIMDIAMYKYLDTLNEDKQVKIRVDDAKNKIQIKKIMYNLKIYKYRHECMEKLLASLTY